jgi:thiol-disulfide isomerase/thioredoxin
MKREAVIGTDRIGRGLVLAACLAALSGRAAAAQPIVDEPAAQPPASTAAEPTAAPASTDAKPGAEFFTSAAEELRKAQAISYRVKYHATGQMEQYSATVEAQVRMLRDASALGYTNGWQVRSTGAGTPKPGAERMNFDVAWRGSTVEFVSHADKKVYEKRSSREAKNTAFSIANSARLQELFSAKPFTRELSPAAEYKVLDRQTIGGVLCDVIEVSVGERKGKSTWAFATTDHLPRRFESFIENVMMTGSTVVELDDVEIETSKPTKLGKSSLRVDVPEGYAEDRPPKLAPVAPAPVAEPAGKTETKPDSGEKKDWVPSQKTAEGAENAVEAEKPATEATPKPAEHVEPPAPAVREAAPFELKASTGGTVSLASLKDRVVILEFGGSWCLPCRESRPELDQLAQRYASRPVTVLALSVRDKSPEAAIDRFKAQNHQFPLLVEADAVAAAYGVGAFPSYYVINGAGEIKHVEQGFTKTTTIDALAKIVDACLGAVKTGS